MIKAILLDMYGVIIKQTGDDFVPYIHRTHPELTAEQIQSPWFRANAGEVTSLDIWRELGFTEDPEELEKEYLDTLELNDNVLDFLRSAQGKYKLALISNDSSGWSRYVREKFQLNKYFDAISISGDIGIKKPDERIFRMTLEKLDVPASDCLYVDDRVKNLKATGLLGMHAVQLNSRGEEYAGTSFATFRELTQALEEGRLETSEATDLRPKVTMPSFL